MLKWYEDANRQQDVIISSRIRLNRNVKGYAFPEQLKDADREGLIGLLKGGIQDAAPNLKYQSLAPGQKAEKDVLRERRVINSAMAESGRKMGLFMSDDESESVLICGDDHIRIQCSMGGLSLQKLWSRANDLDDAVNEKFAYAFDSKYGYLTAFPTTMGTGLKASVLLHLPVTASGRQFRKLLEEITRIGLTIKGAYGEPTENYGALYQISNQKTLGLSEENIIATVHQIAGQIAAQERKARMLLQKEHRGEREDETYKSYGVLKYARRLSLKEGMTYLSQIRAGLNDGYIHMQNPVNIYGLMLGIQPAYLAENAGHPVKEEELDVLRAEYIRSQLPDLDGNK